ncbi:hypothetical protein Gpo141_00010527 [Globisporangium polare]
MSSSGANNSTPTTGSSATPNGNSKEKEPFKVRAELFAPTRLAPKTYALFRARSLVTDVVAHECLLLVLLAAKSAMVSNATLRTEQPRVGILGGGHVGCAVVMALLKHAYPVDKLAISTRQPERTPKCEALLPQNACGGSLLPQYHAITKYYDNARLSRESDVVVLCMPPSQLKSVAIQIKHALGVGVSEAPPTLVVSVLCGASRELLQKSCGTKLVARTKVSVAKLTGAGVDADESDDGLKEDDDDTAVVVAREPQDVAALLQVLADLSALRLHSQRRQQDNDSPLLAQEAAQQAHRVLFGCCTEDEGLGKQLRPEPQGSEGGDAWHAGWDELLAVLQRAMRQRSIDTSGSW